jgi:hypothetical protein
MEVVVGCGFGGFFLPDSNFRMTAESAGVERRPSFPNTTLPTPFAAAIRRIILQLMGNLEILGLRANCSIFRRRRE